MLVWQNVGASYTVSMTTNFVSVAVIFPITQGISMAFQRREQALSEIGNLFGNLRSIWDALHCWKVANKDGIGGEQLSHIPFWIQYSAHEKEKMQELAHELLTAIVVYLQMRRADKSRQQILWCSRDSRLIAEQKCCLQGLPCTCCCTNVCADEALAIRDITQEQRLFVDGLISRVRMLWRE